MSKAKINMPEQVESVKKFREKIAKKRAEAEMKKKLAEDKSKESAPASGEYVYTSSPEKTPTRKWLRKESTDKGKRVESSSKVTADVQILKPESMVISSSLSSFMEPTKFLEKSSNFFPSADKEFLKKKRMEEVIKTGILSTFQAFGAQLHVYDKYLAVNEKCSKLKKANDTFKAEISKLDKTVKELEQQSLNREEEMKMLKEELAKDKADLAEERSAVEALTEQVTSIAVEAMCKARVELFKEYLAGAHVNWQKEGMEAEIADYEEMQRLNAEVSPEGVNEEMTEEEEVDKGHRHVEDAAIDKTQD